MAFVDTHCHLFFDNYKEDLPQVLDRAATINVCPIVIPAIDLASSLQTIQICERYPNLYAAVGIHPSEADSWNEDIRMQLSNLAKHPKVVAIGEIGIDYYHDGPLAETQRVVFQQQLDLAKESNLPVIVHSRKAIDDVWSILSTWQESLIQEQSPLATRPGVLHAFEGDAQMSRLVSEQHFFMGFGGPLTYRKADELRKVCTMSPLTNILIETDAPFLTPHPHRGQRNEPSYLIYIAQKIAELHLVAMDVLEQITTQNAQHLFSWDTHN